jgi:hypothetical protein
MQLCLYLICKSFVNGNASIVSAWSILRHFRTKFGCEPGAGEIQFALRLIFRNSFHTRGEWTAGESIFFHNVQHI